MENKFLHLLTLSLVFVLMGLYLADDVPVWYICRLDNDQTSYWFGHTTRFNKIRGELKFSGSYGYKLQDDGVFDPFIGIVQLSPTYCKLMD